MEPSEPILQFFAFAHLPAHLQAVSKPFHDLAHLIVDGTRDRFVGEQQGNDAKDIVRLCPRNAERTIALRKLLEAKDAAVRAVVFKAA